MTSEGLLSWSDAHLGPETTIRVSSKARRTGQRLHESLIAQYKRPGPSDDRESGEPHG
jgi:hypothetical protein